jgi:hypothetical protein
MHLSAVEFLIARFVELADSNQHKNKMSKTYSTSSCANVNDGTNAGAVSVPNTVGEKLSSPKITMDPKSPIFGICMYKTRLCVDPLCTRSVWCMNAHEESERRTVLENYRDGIMSYRDAHKHAHNQDVLNKLINSPTAAKKAPFCHDPYCTSLFY